MESPAPHLPSAVPGSAHQERPEWSQVKKGGKTTSVSCHREDREPLAPLDRLIKPPASWSLPLRRGHKDAQRPQEKESPRQVISSYSQHFQLAGHCTAFFFTTRHPRNAGGLGKQAQRETSRHGSRIAVPRRGNAVLALERVDLDALVPQR